MELRHLRTLAAIARHGSFTKAAEELHVAQSAISQQVRRLEAELGIELLRRTSRRVEVTSEGQVVLAYAHRVLAEVDGLEAELEELSGVLRGRVSLGAMWPTGTYDLPRVLAAFHARHPNVVIHMIEETADDMLAMLRADELDCAFASVEPDAIGDEFAGTLLFEERLVVAMPPDHPLAAGTHVTFEALAGETLIAYREGSALRRRLERALGAAGVELHKAFFCTEMSAVRALASQGLGVAVLPESIAQQPGPEIAYLPLGAEPLTWPVSLIWRAARRQPPAAKAFLGLALEGLEDRQPAPALQLA
jgi:DNA-binding transcriptional LysR family regulator